MAQPRSWLSILLLMLLTSAAQARPPHKKAMVDYYGPYLPAHLHECKSARTASLPVHDHRDLLHLATIGRECAAQSALGGFVAQVSDVKFGTHFDLFVLFSIGRTGSSGNDQGASESKSGN